MKDIRGTSPVFAVFMKDIRGTSPVFGTAQSWHQFVINGRWVGTETDPKSDPRRTRWPAGWGQ